MSWENPKTNWGQSGQTVPIADDFNRIEGNILHLQDTKETPAEAQAKAEAAAGAVRAELAAHLADDVLHTSQQEKNNWNNKINLSEKGQPNGVATLDETGNVPESQLGNVPEPDFLWKEISSVILENNVPELIIDIPEGYSKIAIEGYVYRSGGTSSTTLDVQFFPHKGQDAYRYSGHVGSSVVHSGGSSSCISLKDVLGYGQCYFLHEIDMQRGRALKDIKHEFTVADRLGESSGSTGKILAISNLDDTDYDEIVSVRYYPSASSANIGKDSKIKVWGVK